MTYHNTTQHNTAYPPTYPTLHDRTLPHPTGTAQWVAYRPSWPRVSHPVTVLWLLLVGDLWCINNQCISFISQWPWKGAPHIGSREFSSSKSKGVSFEPSPAAMRQLDMKKPLKTGLSGFFLSKNAANVNVCQTVETEVRPSINVREHLRGWLAQWRWLDRPLLGSQETSSSMVPVWKSRVKNCLCVYTLDAYLSYPLLKRHVTSWPLLFPQWQDHAQICPAQPPTESEVVISKSRT